MRDGINHGDLEAIRTALRELERRRKARGEDAPTLWLEMVTEDLKTRGFTVREKPKE
jgi:hypothetical protein